MVSMSGSAGVIEFLKFIKHFYDVHFSFIRPELTYKTSMYNKALAQ